MADGTAGSPRAATMADFQQVVLDRSREVPVLVDFWAAWCGPCRTLAPLLDRIASAYAGRADVAKVDTDAEPDLATRYGVRSLPTLALFRNGAPVDALVGVQPEGAIRDLLERHVERPSDRERAAAVAVARDGDVDGAVATLERLVQAEPERVPHLLALLDVLLDAGRADAAAARLAHVPMNVDADPEFVRRHARLDLVRAAQPGGHAGIEAAARAFADGRHEAALDGWVELLRDRDARDGAQRALRAAFTVLGDDALAARYRRRMAALLH